MANFIYSNNNGGSVTITAGVPFWVSKISGFSGSKNNVSTTKSPDQDGETATNATLDKAERTITGTIIANTEAEFEQYRRQLITAFSIKGDGTLHYQSGTVDKICSCKVETVTFGDMDGLTQEFDITLLCPNPFWADISETVNEIALWLPAFEFDSVSGFEIDATDGMEFGERAPSLIVDVENPGDTDCGMKITFYVAAKVVNPQIFNVNTREYFRIVKTMEPGETIEVDTKFGQKTVTGTYNGTTANYFNYADLPGSTFMQLAPGSNPIRYNADSGLDSLNVTIRYSPQYLGV